jgi:hypothetical protein
MGYEVWAPFETIETVWPHGISALPVVPGGLLKKQVTVVRTPLLSTSIGTATCVGYGFEPPVDVIMPVFGSM